MDADVHVRDDDDDGDSVGSDGSRVEMPPSSFASGHADMVVDVGVRMSESPSSFSSGSSRSRPPVAAAPSSTSLRAGTHRGARAQRGAGSGAAAGAGGSAAPSAVTRAAPASTGPRSVPVSGKHAHGGRNKRQRGGARHRVRTRVRGDSLAAVRDIVHSGDLMLSPTANGRFVARRRHGASTGPSSHDSRVSQAPTTASTLRTQSAHPHRARSTNSLLSRADAQLPSSRPASHAPPTIAPAGSPHTLATASTPSCMRRVYWLACWLACVSTGLSVRCCRAV